MRMAEIIAEYGPFPAVGRVHGVTYDGRHVWIAVGDRLCAIDPLDGQSVRAIEIEAAAGSAFDGQHLYQIAGDGIRKIEPHSGAILATIPIPDEGLVSGMAWAEGSLWVGQYHDRRILQLDPETGALLRIIACDRHVTGVTWVDGELWHGTLENETSELVRIDPDSGTVHERLAMPEGTVVTGLESDGADRFFCGGGTSGRVRVVRRPRRSGGAAAQSGTE